MNKKIFITIIIVIVLIVVAATVAGIRFFSGEDSWICQNGEWVKHGNPGAPMPTESCNGQKPDGGKSTEE